MRRGALICILAVLALPGSAWGALDHAGKIAYTAGGDIRTVNPNGTAPANVTGTAAAETCALLSPDGGKVAFMRDGGIWVMNVDGSAAVRLPTKPSYLSYELAPTGCIEDWYPDASAVTFKHDDHCDAGGVWNVYLDGSDMDQITCGSPCTHDTTPNAPDWSPDGNWLAVVGCPGLTEESDLAVRAWPGPGGMLLTNTPGPDPSQWEYAPDFSPDSTTIVFGLDGDAYRIDRDGTDLQLLATDVSVPVWHPDGAQLAFVKAGDIWTMDPDGGNQVNRTNDPGNDTGPVWSPDGRQLAFISSRDGDYDVYAMNRDGTGVTQVTDTVAQESVFGWAPPTGYPRPKSASPLRVSLVPAYTACAAPNRTHGPPLAFGSCHPPVQASSALTVGTPDANGRGANSSGFLRLKAVGELPIDPDNGDQSDVAISFSVTDVRKASDLSDYTGNLTVMFDRRITDKQSSPHPGLPGPATLLDHTYSFPVPCAATGSTSVGSTCSLTTTFDARVPGSILERQRAIWELGRVEVHDANGAPFLTQGVFIP